MFEMKVLSRFEQVLHSVKVQCVNILTVQSKKWNRPVTTMYKILFYYLKINKTGSPCNVVVLSGLSVGLFFQNVLLIESQKVSFGKCPVLNKTFLVVFSQFWR